MFNTILRRYRRLPNLPFVDKLGYAVWKGLFRRLIARKVLTPTGDLRQPRTKKSPWPIPKKTYRRIISANGFMWSGSSATAGLIGEYANVTSEHEGTWSEFEIVRGAGGLLALENVLKERNVFERDLAIRLFMCYAEHLYVNCQSFYGEEFLVATREFVNEIIDIKSVGKVGVDFCRHVAALGVDGINHILGRPLDHEGECVFYLKDLTTAEFRVIASRYVRKILSAIESEEIMLLDQGSADFTNDIDRMRDYFGPDMISVYTWRDPRDVFTAANVARELGREQGMVPEDPESFVRWYKSMHRELLGYKHDHLLVVRFEDLIFDYDAIVKQVEEACHLKPEEHVRPKALFNPPESLAVSVGLWREYSEKSEENKRQIEYIFKALPDFCYTKPYVIPKRITRTSTGVMAQ